MQLFWGSRARLHLPTRIHPALISFADECCGMLARLVIYVGVLALLAIVGIHQWDQWPARDTDQPAVRQDWSLATRSYPAFAVSQFFLSDKTNTYEIFRHPEGGRKDVLRWALAGDRPAVELEIYRAGGELSRSGPAMADIADRMDPTGIHPLETAGVVDSKFGSVTLFRMAGAAGNAPGCLGFIKQFDDPELRFSGWSCQGDTLPARRAAIGCMLDRLMLLTAGNDPKLAELFARAELRRGSCTAVSADWTTEAENPHLRGRL